MTPFFLSHEEALGFLDGGFTCAIFKGEQVYKSQQRGVTPLLEWLEKDADFHDFIAVDKVVGKAAAFLYVLLGVKGVYAFVISEAAEKVLRAHGVDVAYQLKVAAIRNRTNSGFCPMEQAVWNIEEPKTACLAIVKTFENLQKGKDK